MQCFLKFQLADRQTALKSGLCCALPMCMQLLSPRPHHTIVAVRSIAHDLWYRGAAMPCLGSISCTAQMVASVTIHAAPICHTCYPH